jgi:hypothetical protein
LWGADFDVLFRPLDQRMHTVGLHLCVASVEESVSYVHFVAASKKNQTLQIKTDCGFGPGNYRNKIRNRLPLFPHSCAYINHQAAGHLVRPSFGNCLIPDITDAQLCTTIVNREIIDGQFSFVIKKTCLIGLNCPYFLKVKAGYIEFVVLGRQKFIPLFNLMPNLSIFHVEIMCCNHSCAFFLGQIGGPGARITLVLFAVHG